MTWREPQPTDVTLSEEKEVGWPDTKDDEFAKEDAPEQEYDDD